MMKIYRPAKSVMQSAYGKPRSWIAEFEPSLPRLPDPLMGWVSAAETQTQVRLCFADREEAVAFAQREGVDYVVIEPQERRIHPKSYADNFRSDRLVF